MKMYFVIACVPWETAVSTCSIARKKISHGLVIDFLFDGTVEGESREVALSVVGEKGDYFALFHGAVRCYTFA